MATVSSLVVRRRLATMRQVEDALARQTLYGGDVVTNLLEVAPPPSTDEAALTAVLAEALELPAAPLDALRAPDPAAIARVPRAVAEKHGFVPIALREGAIVVAVAEPLPSLALEELASSLGAEIRQEAAIMVRLVQALERAYGVPMDRRSRRIAALLDGGTAAASVPPRRAAIPDLPDDPIVQTPIARAPVEPTPSPGESSRPPPATTIRASRPGAAALRWFVKSARSDDRKSEPSPRGSSPGRRRRGPYTREDAERVFADPRSTDAVLSAVLEYTAQWFAYVAVFLVHDDLAEGWDAAGAGASGDLVRKMGVPLDLPSLFADARDSRSPIVRPRPRDGLDAVVAADLERSASGDVVVAPVVVGKRVVGLLYADDAGQRIDEGDIGEVFSVIAAAGTALARMIMRKKGKPVALPAPPPPKERRTPEPESIAGRAEILAKALLPKRSSRPAPLEPRTPPSGRGKSDAPRSVTREGEAKPVAERRTTEAPPTVPPDTNPYGAPRVRPASLAPIVAPMAEEPPRHRTDPMGPKADAPRRTDPMGVLEPAAPRSTPPLPLERVSQPMSALAELEAAETPSLGLPESQPESEPDARPIELTKPPPPRAVIMQHPTPPPPHLAGRRPLGPTIPREEPDEASARAASARAANAASTTQETSDSALVETSEVTDDELEELLSLADRSDAPVPTRESERFEVYSPREPPRPITRSSEHELPKVIVAIEPELVAMVSRVIKGGEAGEKAARDLASLGVAALPAIMDRFPGPTRVDRTTPIAQVPPPTQAGPLLALLTALGRLALRDVLARAGDPVPETRFWATWLLTEIVDPESALPLVPRLVDDDLAVRRAAWIAGRVLLEKYPRVGDAMLDPLVGVVLDPGGGTSLRIRGAIALGELRDRRAAEGLVLGLEAREPELAAACHEALVTITGHDPTRRNETWGAWLAKHGQQSRVEWLIEALLEDDHSLREAAAQELKDLTKVYFGYYANLPRAEREQAYRRYRKWWEEEGRSRFGV